MYSVYNISKHSVIQFLSFIMNCKAMSLREEKKVHKSILQTVSKRFFFFFFSFVHTHAPSAIPTDSHTKSRPIPPDSTLWYVTYILCNAQRMHIPLCLRFVHIIILSLRLRCELLFEESTMQHNKKSASSNKETVNVRCRKPTTTTMMSVFGVRLFLLL